MAIKKRTHKPVPGIEPEQKKLVIVAKPKTPVPTEPGMVEAVYGKDAPGGAVRRLAHVAADCGDANADDYLTIQDRVVLMRTAYDTSNPQEQRYRNRVRNRGTAITAMCITCQGGRKAVTECIDTTCPLWAFRFGSDPFYGKKVK